jgi:hypothetical protein
MYRLAVRLSKHDKDLLLLAENGGFGRICKESVRRFVGGTNFAINPPPLILERNAPRIVQVAFDEEKDTELISFLRSLKKGCVATCVKILVRDAYASPDIRAFLGGDTARSPQSPLRGVEEKTHGKKREDGQRSNGREGEIRSTSETRSGKHAKIPNGVPAKPALRGENGVPAKPTLRGKKREERNKTGASRNKEPEVLLRPAPCAKEARDDNPLDLL